MRVLVLGGTGAMGEPLVKMLSEYGGEVYVTSRRERESKGNIHYIHGDAHDVSFIKHELDKNYDVIVDFMIYSTEDFKERSKLYLNSTKQYVFLSSARVYANSRDPITENSPRLLDVCKDVDYLETDEYALAKARSENTLFNSGMKNWTIIRPYITYNIRKLQLGGLELETWLTATLSGRAIVLPKDVGIHETTMTHGNDVARAMVALIGNDKALGEAFHVTCADHMKWRDVAEIYKDVLEEKTGNHVEIYEPESSERLSDIMRNAKQIKYDRTYDRLFNNSKLIEVCGGRTDGDVLIFSSMKSGLKQCLAAYLDLPRDQKEMRHNIRYEAWVDKFVGGRARFKEIDDTKKRIKYIAYYYVPGLINILKKYK